MIDISNWKEFKLSKIIPDIHNAKAYNNSDLMDSDTDDYVLYITRTDSKNGVSRYVANEDYEGLEEANAITIGDTTATIYFQDRPFIAGPHIIILRAPWFNKYTGLFLVSILNMEKDKYPIFGRSFSKDLIRNTKVLLPVDKNGHPDYNYMEEYMKSLNADVTTIPDYFLNEGYDKACWYMDNIDEERFEKEYASRKVNNKIELSDREWKDFKLGDNHIFDIKRGDSVYIKNMNEGDIPYISTTRENNGITTYVSKSNREGNLITLAYDGSIGACFYQSNPFFASEKIVTIDLVQHKLNKYIALFLIPIIQLESQMYAYGGRKWTVEQQLKETKIKLPVDDKNSPDFDFMESYIKSLPYSAKI